MGGDRHALQALYCGGLKVAEIRRFQNYEEHDLKAMHSRVVQIVEELIKVNATGDIVTLLPVLRDEIAAEIAARNGELWKSIGIDFLQKYGWVSAAK